jgi:hypothetical protein
MGLRRRFVRAPTKLPQAATPRGTTSSMQSLVRSLAFAGVPFTLVAMLFIRGRQSDAGSPLERRRSHPTCVLAKEARAMQLPERT